VNIRAIRGPKNERSEFSATSAQIFARSALKNFFVLFVLSQKVPKKTRL